MIIKKILILITTIALATVSIQIFADQHDDVSLAWNIETKIRGTPSITTAFINIKVRDGVVTLTGMVDSPFQEKDAINIAESVQGVKRVDSYITVRGTQGPNIQVVPTKTIELPSNTVVVPENTVVVPNNTVVVPERTVVVPDNSSVVPGYSAGPGKNSGYSVGPGSVVIPANGANPNTTVVLPDNTDRVGNTVVVPTTTTTVPGNAVVVPSNTGISPGTETVIVPERTPSGQPNLVVPNLPPATPAVPGALQPAY